MKNDIFDALLGFYRRKPEIYRNANIHSLARISDGWENEVYSFTLEHGESAQTESEDLILRIYPGDGAPRKASREFGGMKKLYEAGFPMPEVLILELDESYFGKPFVIMEKINGRSMGTVFGEVSEDKRMELLTLFCKMFVDLHAMDWKEIGEIQPPYEIKDPYSDANFWILYAREHVSRFEMDGFSPVVDWLEERVSEVPCKRLSVIHLDYHPHNILIRDDGKAFVIDWTNITVADHRMDLAWTVLLSSTYGNPESRKPILDEYERISGQKTEQMEFFDVAASLRRLLSMAVSLIAGAEKLGMRPEAAESIKQNVGHIENVYTFMRERTGINIPEMDELISSLS